MNEDSLLSMTTGQSGGKAGVASLLAGMSMSGIIVGLVFSGVGYFYLNRGRAEGNTAKIACGVGMMLYPYFVTNTFYMILVGLALAAAPYVMERF